MIGLMLFVLASAAAGFIGAELFGWLMPLARWLVRRGVSQLPAEHRARYAEEWIGDIERKAQGRNVTALVWALGTCITAHGLAKTLERSALATPTRGVVTKLMSRIERLRATTERVYQVRITWSFMLRFIAVVIAGTALLYFGTRPIRGSWFATLAFAGGLGTTCGIGVGLLRILYLMVTGKGHPSTQRRR